MTSTTLDFAAPHQKLYRAGTLTYDRRGLTTVFFWLLWGDFCLFLMDSGVRDTLVPTQLAKAGASNTLISLINISFVELMILVLCPLISVISDRHRSPRGRRIPFLIWSAPPMALTLTLVGFSPTVAAWLHSISPYLQARLSAANLTIALLTLFYVIYRFFDVIPQSVYYYLYADVIPPEKIGTFVCLFRVCGVLGTFTFNAFLIQYCGTHPGLLCLGAAALYLVTILLLCFRVKEGDYPPSPPRPQGPFLQRTATSVRRFCRESFSQAFYWKAFLFATCFLTGMYTFRQFLILYATKDMHMDLGAYGKVLMFRDGAQIAVFLALGPIIDKFHPMRVGLVGLILVIAASLGGTFFVSSTFTFSLWVVLAMAAAAVAQGATNALGPRIYPRSHYGQFCAAAALVFHFVQMIFAFVLGLLTDRFGNAAIFPWFAAFTTLSIIFLYLLYRDWQRRGGDAAFTPPVPV